VRRVLNNAEYLDVFIDESQEHLQAVNDNLLKLEAQPSDLSIVGEVFRSAHTLKGMAATMGFEDLAHLTHCMENVLDLMRNSKLDATSEVLDVVFAAVDDLEAMVVDISSGGEGKRDVTQVTTLLDVIEKGGSPAAAAAASKSETKDKANDQPEDVTHRNPDELFEDAYDQFELTVISQSYEQGYYSYQVKITLDERTMLKAARVFMVFEALEQVGEIIKASPPSEDLEEEKFDLDFVVTLLTKVDADEIVKRVSRVSEITDVQVRQLDVDSLKRSNSEKEAQQIADPQTEVAATQTESIPAKTLDKKPAEDVKSASKKSNDANKTIRVNIERLDVLMNLFEELVIDRGRLEQIASELKNNELNETVERMSRISGDLQEIILNMRMMPVEQVFNRFPRMVRSLSKDLNKKVNLQIVGAETELDRTIIDEIGDPLVHLLRNSIDHGVETPEKRRELGKPEEGTVILKAFHSGNNVFIVIEDDGAGIDRDKIISIALKNEVVTEEEVSKMTDQQIYGLLFAAGFSTAEKVTDVSGRGVGLDVVRSTFESLGGIVTVDSTLGKGSVFSIQLPLTLSIIDVMLIQVEDEKYAIPLSSIVETAIVNKEDVYSAHNQKVIDFRGKVVPLVFLKDIFEIPTEDNHIEEEFYSLVIIHKGDKIAGIVVDSLIGQYDIVLKSLGNYLTNVFAISGATILGNGQVALIVDTNALIK
jgi:two-component system chemotaxis sensor kinase CheA